MALKDDFADLEARLTRVEGHLGLKSPEEERADQEARDKELLSRFANSHEEAVEQERARARLEGRDPNVDEQPAGDEQPPPES